MRCTARILRRRTALSLTRGYTHTSVALMDALLAVSLPVIEVHLSDPSRREEFRHRSYVAMAAKGSVVGLGFTGYRRAMEALMALAE